MNLPMCAVVNPAAHGTAKPLMESSHLNPSANNNNNISNGTSPDAPLSTYIHEYYNKSMSDIIKCLSCGAPHVTKQTHFRPVYEPLVVCYFCGKTSSTHIADQRRHRPMEFLSEETFDLDPQTTPTFGDWILQVPCFFTNDPNSSSSVGGVGGVTSEMGVIVPTTTTTPKNSNKKKNRDEDDKEDVIMPVTSIPKALDYRLPAMACPPVWWIVVDATVPPLNSYWKVLTDVLLSSSMLSNSSSTTTSPTTTSVNNSSSLIQDIPDHVHVGIIAVSATMCRSYDLSASTSSSSSKVSAAPHVLHYPLTAQHIPLSLVPADKDHKPRIQAAIQSLIHTGGEDEEDHYNKSTILENEEEKKEDEDEDMTEADSPTYGMALSLALEIILEFMQPAWHPGTVNEDTIMMAKNGNDKDSKKNKKNKNKKKTEPIIESPIQASPSSALKYAGGKISCFLARPPLEIVPNPTAPSPPPFGPGGIAGACVDKDQGNLWGQEDDEEDSKEEETEAEDNLMEPSDWTPVNLANYVEPLDPEDSLHVLGKKCARAALGVDLFIIAPSEWEPTEAPVVVNAASVTTPPSPEEEEDDDEDETEEDEIQGPIYVQGPIYGIPLLAVLTSATGAPGPLLFGTRDQEACIQSCKNQLLARVPWHEGLIFGTKVRSRITKGFEVEDEPIESVGKSKLQLAPYLSAGGFWGAGISEGNATWTMGSCDAHTSVVLDFQILGQPDMVVKTDGMGVIALKPALQICVAYTCVEKDADDGEFYTVRKMKISTMSLPLTGDSEPLYDMLDPEALALILYQKLLLSAVQDGFVEAQNTAESWLQALLIHVYQSAQVEQAKIEERNEATSENTNEDEKFDQEPSKMVACERLLDVEGGKLSDDEILLGQGHPKIAVMPLIVYSLMQCDALRPTLGAFAPSMDARCAAATQMFTMNPASLSKCIAPCLQLWSTEQDKILKDSLDLNHETLVKAVKECNCPDAVFFLDSPQQILVYRADQGTVPYGERSSLANLMLGPRLRSAIHVAAKAYRTRPVVRCHLKAVPFLKGTAMAFNNCLVEDCPTYGGVEDYEEWKKLMAAEVRA